MEYSGFIVVVLQVALVCTIEEIGDLREEETPPDLHKLRDFNRIREHDGLLSKRSIGSGPPLLPGAGEEPLFSGAALAASTAATGAPATNRSLLHFTRQPLSQVVKNNARAELHCSVDRGDVGIEWFYAGRPLETGRRKYIRDNGTLVISKVKRNKNDGGAYQCLVSWRSGAMLSRPAQLTIASMARKFSVSPDNSSAVEGGSALLRCRLDSVPPAEISWLRDGLPVPVNDSDRFWAEVPGLLGLRQLTADDAGVYSCEGKNGVMGKKRVSDSGRLTITPAAGVRGPRLLTSPPGGGRLNVSINSSLVLPCLPDGSPEPVVTWARADGSALPSGAAVTSSGSLRLDTGQFKDSGSYTCTATNEAGSVSQEVQVWVLVPPVIISELPPVLERRPGRLIRLQCEADGYPRPNITWLKDSQRITSDGRVRATNGELFISNMQTKDAGIYQCVAYNAVGYAARAVMLAAVRGTPPPPTDLRVANVTARAVLLQWNVSGEPKPLGYTVHHFKTNSVGSTDTVVVPNTTHWLTSLQPYTNYTVYVRTYSQQMASDPSESITLLTAEDVPSQAPSVSLVAVSSTTLNVSWEPLPPELSNGVVTGYRIISQPANEPASASMVQVDGSRRFFLIEGLDPGRAYDVRVLAATRAGYPSVAELDGGNWVLQKMPPLSSETAQGPRPPDVHLVVSNHTIIRITWGSRPSGGAPAAVRYEVMYRRQEQGQRLSGAIRLPGNTTEYYLTDLAPSTFYEVHVRAIAADGQTAESIKTIATLAPEVPAVEPSGEVVLEPPTDLQVEPLNSSAVLVSWQQPPSARTIQYFTVKYRPLRRLGGTATRLSSTSRQLKITGLEAYTYYEFSVRSHDAEDHFGPYSEGKKVRTLEGAPSPPENVTWSPVDASRIQVRWRPPRQPHGRVSGYRVLYTDSRAAAPAEWQILDIPASSGTAMQIRQLVPNQQYWLQVRARTAAAMGELSPPMEFQIRAVLETSGQRQTSLPVDTPTYAAIVATVLLLMVLFVLGVVLLLWWRRRAGASPAGAPSQHRPHLNGSAGGAAAAPAHEALEMEALTPMLTHVPPAANQQLDTKGGHPHPSGKPANGRANGFVHPLYLSTERTRRSSPRDRHGSGGDANESRVSLINNNSSLLSQGSSTDNLPP